MNALAPPRERLPHRREWPHPGPWLLLFAAGFAVRALALWLVGGARPLPAGAADIDSVAWNLASGAGFALDGPAGPVPTAHLPPLLPWLVSLVYRAAGHRQLAALLLQCALGSLVPLLLVALAGVTFGLTTGRLAAWIAIFDPLLARSSASLGEEALFSTLLLVGLLATAEWVKTPRRGRALGTGLLWGLGALAQPAAIALPILVTGWAWTPLGLTLAPRERVRQVLFLILGVVLAIGPWTLRNAVVLRTFVPITSEARRPVAGRPPGAKQAATGLRAAPPEPTGARPPPGAQSPTGAAAGALAFVGGRLDEWPAQATRGLAGFWRLGIEDGGGPGGSRGGLARGLPSGIALWFALLYLGSLWGLARTMRGARRWFQSLPLLAILYLVALVVLIPGLPRSRAPIEPALALYAAVGLEDLRHRLRARARGIKLVAGKWRGAG